MVRIKLDVDIYSSCQLFDRCQQLKDRPPAEHQWKERNRFHADVKKFKNMEYCGTYKAGYTFWSYMFTRQFKLIKWPTLSGPKANEVSKINRLI